MEWLQLIGILIIILGFLFKFDTIAVILVAALILAIHNFLKSLFLLFLPTYEYANDFITAWLAVLNNVCFEP